VAPGGADPNDVRDITGLCVRRGDAVARAPEGKLRRKDASDAVTAPSCVTWEMSPWADMDIVSGAAKMAMLRDWEGKWLPPMGVAVVIVVVGTPTMPGTTRREAPGAVALAIAAAAAAAMPPALGGERSLDTSPVYRCAAGCWTRMPTLLALPLPSAAMAPALWLPPGVGMGVCAPPPAAFAALAALAATKAAAAKVPSGPAAPSRKAGGACGEGGTRGEVLPALFAARGTADKADVDSDVAGRTRTLGESGGDTCIDCECCNLGCWTVVIVVVVGTVVLVGIVVVVGAVAVVGITVVVGPAMT